MSCFIGYAAINVYYDTAKGVQVYEKSYTSLEQAMPVVNSLSVLSDVFSIEVKNPFTSEVFYSWRRCFMLKDIEGSCISKEEIQEKSARSISYSFDTYANQVYSYEWVFATDKNGKVTFEMKRH